MSRLRMPIKLAVAFALLIGSGVWSAGNSYAATNPYTPEGVCGRTYRQVAPVQRLTTSLNGVIPVGNLYLLYSSTTGYNCVVLLKVADVGVPTLTKVWITNNVEGPSMVDENYYKYYASTKIYARGQCIQYFGSQAFWLGGGVAYQSPWGWCG